MIIDTSAIVAILRDEAGARDCALAIEKNLERRISAVNFVEAALVIDGSRDPIASRRFDEFFKEANIAVEAITLEPASEEPDEMTASGFIATMTCYSDSSGFSLALTSSTTVAGALQIKRDPRSPRTRCATGRLERHLGRRRCR